MTSTQLYFTIFDFTWTLTEMLSIQNQELVSIYHFLSNKESSKIVLKLFLKKPSTNYETPSSYESTDTKIFKKIEQELAF